MDGGGEEAVLLFGKDTGKAFWGVDTILSLDPGDGYTVFYHSSLNCTFTFTSFSEYALFDDKR